MDNKIASLLIEQLNDAWKRLMDFDATCTDMELRKRETYRLEGIRQGLENLLMTSGIKYTESFYQHPLTMKPVSTFALIGKEA